MNAERVRVTATDRRRARILFRCTSSLLNADRGALSVTGRASSVGGERCSREAALRALQQQQPLRGSDYPATLVFRRKSLSREFLAACIH